MQQTYGSLFWAVLLPENRFYVFLFVPRDKVSILVIGHWS